MKDIIERIWPLPPPEKRRLWPFIILPKHVKNVIRLERDGDYLCYLAGALTQIIGTAFLVILLIDTLGRFGWFVDLQELANQKVLFVVTWMDTMGKIAPSLIIVFYLRLRLVVGLKNDQIPYFVSKNLLRGRQRREWIQIAAALLVVGMLVISIAEPYARGFMEMYSLENKIWAVVLEQIGLTVVLPLFVSLCISMALILEKSIRFFPQAQEDLERW